jgi:hypothetical protein
MNLISLFRYLTVFCFLFSSVSCASSQSSSAHHSYAAESKYAKATIIHGKAVAPKGAPQVVVSAIEAGNRIVGKPYRRGGGHGKLEDSAYDCSGAVSYVLCKCGLLDSPTTSAALRTYGDKGKGKHITIYAKNGHTFMTIAGLRLDTTSGGDERCGPRWLTTPRSLKGFLARHPKDA